MTRILTALALLAVVIPVLVFSDTVVFPIFLALVGIMCVWEVFKCKNLNRMLYLTVPTALFVGATPFLPKYLCIDYITESIALFAVILVLYLVYIYFTGVFFYGKIKTDDITYCAFFGIFLSLGVLSVAGLRNLLPKLYLLTFFTPWVSDALAMYSGKLFGKKKLCPNISPKKTVAGAIGSMVGTMLIVLGYIFVVNTWFDGGYSYIAAAVLALPAGVLVQLGDLSASVVKRNFGVKDYGSILPGHGGFMDRVDSILPLAMVSFVLYVGKTILWTL